MSSAILPQTEDIIITHIVIVTITSSTGVNINSTSPAISIIVAGLIKMLLHPPYLLL